MAISNTKKQTIQYFVCFVCKLLIYKLAVVLPGLEPGFTA